MIAVSGPLQGRTFPLRSSPCTVGRSSGCEVQIPDFTVSRAHCLVERSGDGGWRVRDLESGHGTFVNDRPVRSCALRHGDLLRVGGTLLFFSCLALRAERDPSMPSFRAGASAPHVAHLKRLEDHPFAQRGVWPAVGGEGGGAAEERGALLRLCSESQAARDAEALGDAALELLRARLPSCRGAVLLAEAAMSPWFAASALTTSELRQLTCAPATAAEQALYQPALALALRERAALLVRDGGAEILSAPLAVGDQLFGAIYLEAERGVAFEERHLDFLLAVAVIASPALERLLQVARLRQENRQLRGGAEPGEHAAERLVGDSDAMGELRAQLRRAAAAGSSVLLVGEPGSGKESCARVIHAASARGDGPFAVLRAAALAELLAEQELFGQAQRGPAGTSVRRPGALERARGGTLYLDELGELPASLQGRLLRALQERELERAGGDAASPPIPLDVRVIASVSGSPLQLVQQGKLRDELLSRLGAVTLSIPPLRARRDDIPLLVRHFARLAAERIGRRTTGGAVRFEDGVSAALAAYAWPGNVRQLGNVVERAFLLGCDDCLQLDALPDEVRAAAGAP